MDGDGDNDVLSASYSDDKIAWYENNGSQVFTARSISTTANGATSVFAADVDGDGDTDVLSASGIDHKIAWYENSGNQVFTARTISTTATGARSVFAADVDGDGDTDVLSASEFDDKIAWYENNGSQIFTARTISTTANGAQSVFATDMDGDGDTDVLSASIADDKIAWYENNGSQVFTARTISTTADGARSIFAADVDGDGDTDVLSASANDSKIAWYENNGSQVFTARTISTTDDGASSVFAADMDGDGDIDVLSASENDDTIAWYENRDGDFNNDGSYDCSDINALATAVAMGGYDAQFDLNGDNSLSLADVDQWRVEGGNANLGAGRVYRAGDANLNGAVDGSDYGIWNTHKFTVNSKWCDGNFNADAFVDGSDYAVWNSNKFTSSDSFGVLLNDGRSHTAISPVHALNSYTITVRNGFTLVGEARTSGDLFDSNSRSGMDSRDMLDHAVIWISSMSNCDDSGWSSTYSDIPWRSTKRRILERNDVIDHVFGLRHGIDHMNGAPQSGVD